MQLAENWMIISLFLVSFIVGIFMFTAMAWLMLFRMEDLKECWELHVGILRYYVGLTVIGAAVNLTLGICGTLYVLANPE